MDDIDGQRKQTLQALEAFVETQKILLARQRADIEALKRLKVDLVQKPAEIVKHFTEELSGSEFHISEQADCRLSLPKDIQWSAFGNSDIEPLQNFTQRTNDTQKSISAPSSTQRSSLSDLQKLVKRARQSIVDPILLRFADLSSPEPDSDDDRITMDPVERKRQAEREKIRELKKRQIRGGLSLPLSSMAGAMGVFIRHDVDEEAMDVDVSIDDADEGAGSQPKQEPEPEPPARPYATKAPPPVSPPKPKSRATVKVKVKKDKPHESRKKSKIPSPEPISDEEVSDAASDDSNDDDTSDSDADSSSTPKSTTTLRTKTKAKGKGKSASSRARAAKPKPETYKQAWSASEQNLLEQLLDTYPDGERFRWQKISQAMGGRRTPRQVASRVQKYFEKLRRVGLL
ncbi:hypothetical protein BDN70DRAFT_872790 [Pholiota conissans]|uniref:Myb-like domain-containing protein n=1 Tax=Pholiota conissans TaxID=109636 RepID=A0A9P5ZA56_9AGAR|nr:hypothetical protein BDN70DRAFT_872790 [Pholiota conissans]